MSEIKSGGGEVSSSSEVSEVSSVETGGETSEATQGAAIEEASEAGGFQENTDTTESPEDSTKDYEEFDSDEEPDDSKEVGFSEGDDAENAVFQYDDADYENEDASSDDKDSVGFDDFDDDVNDGTDEDTNSETEPSDLPVDENLGETEDTASAIDGEETDDDMDNDMDNDGDDIDDNWEDQEDEDVGEPEDYSDEETLDDNGEKTDSDMDNDSESERDKEEQQDEQAKIEDTNKADAVLPEDVANKSDISSETQENLGAFEQNKWDNLSQVEKEQAVEKLRDSIAEDLQLENKPNIAYYNNEDSGDYGGYAASTNTIYINRFNMDDAAETADTIAHESRHCWQHERADNPQTEQDYQFKENFDDYVRPEDDFYEYQNQPVEADARSYAQEVKDAIPVSDGTSGMDAKQNYEGDDHKDNNDVPPSTTGPPEISNEKVESSKLPEDFERKIDGSFEKEIVEVNQKISDISESPLLDSREKAEKIAKELNTVGFEKVDATTVLGFTDQKIEVVQMDGSQELYRRGYDTEGKGEYGYGSWWSDERMSIEDTRNKLAVCESWGNPLTGEYQSKPESGTLALKGTAAPQDVLDKNGAVVEHRDGGATQYYIETPNKEWCNKEN